MLFRTVGLAVASLIILAIASLALPVPVWRTGELWAPPLRIVEGGPEASISERIWIDTDAACGVGGRTDPDDCLALLLLVPAPDLEVAGISTVFGNAELDLTDATTRSLLRRLEHHDQPRPFVHRGSRQPADEMPANTVAPAHLALRAALAKGPLTVIALGPMTNIAAALRGKPELQSNVTRLIVVMGRRPGHIFHPSEGSGHGMFFGHGPIFRDFNFDMDRAAAKAVIEMGLPMTFIPYEAARQVSLTKGDLDELSASGGASRWAAEGARDWLEFWQKDVGRNGFYPFDLLAAAYAIEQDLFNCARTAVWIGKDARLWNLWFYDPPALLVGRRDARPSEAAAAASAVYCPDVDPALHGWLMHRLVERRD